MAEIPKRHCRGCRDAFPATPEYFYRDRHDPLGVGYTCKTCLRLKANAFYTKKKAAQEEAAANNTDALSPHEKRCSRCRSVKPANLDYFAPDPRNTTSGLHSWCRVCQKDARMHPNCTNAGKTTSTPILKPYTPPEGMI